MQKKVLFSSIQNNRNDNLVYKNRLNLLQKQLKKSLFTLSVANQNLVKSQNRRKQALKFQKDLKYEMKELKADRQIQYNTKENAKQEFRILREDDQVRAAHLGEVAERVMDEKDSTEKQIQKLMLTHKFLEEMMRVKMEREMGRFKLIEQAFKSIKLATGVSETTDLVNKFLNKEAAYGQLLYKIAQNQKKIDALRVQNQKLVLQRKRLGNDMTLYQPPAHQKVDSQLQAKEFAESDSQSKQVKLIENKTRNWLYRVARKLQVATGDTLSFSNMEEGVAKMLGKVSEIASKCDAKDVKPIEIQNLNYKEYVERNVRVRIKPEEDEQEE